MYINFSFLNHSSSNSFIDLVLGKEISDVDIATSATPEEVKSLFSHTVDVGIEHGTVLVLHHHDSYEVTTFVRKGRTRTLDIRIP